LYPVVFDYAASKFPFAFIRELQALGFRNYTDFVQLLLMGFAFFVLGRQKKLDLFLLSLLCISSVVGFRAQRDAWFVCIPAAACLATAFRETNAERREARPLRKSIWEQAGITVALAFLLFLYARLIDFNTASLRQAVAEAYPVRAINFLRDHPQPGPLYNGFDWGDFITWYMPQYPVAIDGRTDLYGDELDTRFYMTENGDPSYVDDPYLKESQFVLLSKQKPLAGILASDPEFTLVYQDSQAVVFVRR
jgi:hypothetical protein